VDNLHEALASSPDAPEPDVPQDSGEPEETQDEGPEDAPQGGAA